jgi:uridine phosphorylase
MFAADIDGTQCGLIPRTIGGPYAVLVAEQLSVSGTRVVIGLTSAGRVAPSLPVPGLVVATSAVRDEGTSYHYLPAAPLVAAPSGVAIHLQAELSSVGLPVESGCVWTTDAPYRETREQFEEHIRRGVLAVEMQAASLFAFAHACQMLVGIVAHVTNAINLTNDNFDKGPADLSLRLFRAVCRAGLRIAAG